MKKAAARSGDRLVTILRQPEKNPRWRFLRPCRAMPEKLARTPVPFRRNRRCSEQAMLGTGDAQNSGDAQNRRCSELQFARLAGQSLLVERLVCEPFRPKLRAIQIARKLG